MRGLPMRRSLVVQSALLMLEDRTGRLTPRAVVDAARDENHPLHGEFEWDDTVAAEAYRLDQARQLIADVRVEVVTSTLPIGGVAYVRDPSKLFNEQGYRSTGALLGERDQAMEAIRAEVERVSACLGRAERVASTLGAPLDVVSMLTDAQVVVGRLLGRLKVLST